MKKTYVYIAIAVVLALVAGLVFLGQNKTEVKPQSADLSRASFGQRDRGAGGTYAAFKLLPSMFNQSIPQVITKPFPKAVSKISTRQSYNLYMIIADKLYVTEEEVEQMLSFAEAGNDLFIAVNDPNALFEKALDFTYEPVYVKEGKGVMQYYKDTLQGIDTSFVYDGLLTKSYFSKIDTNTTTVLGYNSSHNPDFIRVSKGEGQIYFLLNPYTFCNYFLLQQHNVAALETQLSYIDSYSTVYWDDYYRKLLAPRASSNFSEWQVLLKFPALRWALWLIFLLALVYVLIEGKRRQRIMPKKALLTNNSLEFVEALGQLYYQQHNNYNLAQKMIVHLLEHIRQHFYLNTNILNGEFISALAHKTTLPEEKVNALFAMIHTIQVNQHATDEELMELYQHIQSFYLNAK